MGVYEYLCWFTEGVKNPPIKYAIWDILLEFLVLLSCLLPVLIASRVKPLIQGKEKMYFWSGVGFALVYWIIKRQFNYFFPVGGIIAAVLAIVEFFILKKFAKTKKKLVVSLVIQSVLIVIFYFVFSILFSAIIQWILGV